MTTPSGEEPAPEEPWNLQPVPSFCGNVVLDWAMSTPTQRKEQWEQMPLSWRVNEAAQRSAWAVKQLRDGSNDLDEATQNAFSIAPEKGHDFLAPSYDGDEGENLWHGYPDECFSTTSFADSLVAKVLYDAWGIQPPISVVRMAIVIDFASEREAQAKASLANGWNGAWEFPMGIVNTVHSRTETNEQNARIARHLTFIGTAISQRDFDQRVIRRLLDVHSCPDGKHCEICRKREPRALPDALQILADGLELSEIHLFSKWKPSPGLRSLLNADGINILHHDLSSIPEIDVEANRYYSIWNGTERQGHDFRNVVWAPAWRR